MSAIGTLLESVILPVRSWDPARDAPDKPLTYVDLSSIDRDRKEITDPQRMLGTEAPSRARQLLQLGDVLVSTVRPSLNAVAQVSAALDGATGSTGFCVLRADASRLDGRYLFHWVRSPGFIAEMVSRTTGASYPAVSDRVVRGSKIPLPPLPEQRRIAAILDKADAVRRKRQQTLDLADQFLRSAFLDMFGEGIARSRQGDCPAGWVILTLDEIKAPGNYTCAGGPFGSSLTRSDYIGAPGVPVIRGSNLSGVSGEFSEDGLAFVSEQKAVELLQNTAKPGDIVFTQRGTLGQVARIPTDSRFPLYVISQSQMKLTVNQELADPDYVVWYFRSPFLLSVLRSRVLTTGVPHINLGILKQLPVILPPMALQQHFGKILAQKRHDGRALADAVSAAVALQRALTQHAF